MLIIYSQIVQEKKYTYKQTDQKQPRSKGLANTLKSKHVDFAFPVKFTLLIIILKDSAKQIIGIKLFWKSAKITNVHTRILNNQYADFKPF